MIWAWVPYSRAVLWCRSLFHWRWHLGLDLDHYFYFLWHLRSKGLAWRWVAPKDLRRPKQASYLSPLIEHDTSVPLMSKVVLLTDRTEVKRHWSISFSSSLGAVPLGAAVEFSLSHHPWELLWLFFFFSKGKCESCFLPARESTEVLVKHVQCSVVSICQVKWKIQVLFTFGYSCLSIIFLYCNCLLWLPNSQTTQKRSLAKDGSGVLQEC